MRAGPGQESHVNQAQILKTGGGGGAVVGQEPGMGQKKPLNLQGTGFSLLKLATGPQDEGTNDVHDDS